MQKLPYIVALSAMFLISACGDDDKEAARTPDGGPCLTNSDCASNSCVNRICKTMQQPAGICAGKPVGTPCGAGMLCNAQNQCAAAPQPPANVCAGKPVGTPCGAGMVCNAQNQCVAAPQPPVNVCDGKSAGTPCGTGMVCNAQNQCVAAPQPPVNVCDGKSAGTPCGTGMVCDAQNQCVAAPQPPAGSDPCKGVTCSAGKCEQGICVTDEMIGLQDGDMCDPLTFTDFCHGNEVVYCDKGIIIRGMCDEGCAVYQQTYFGMPKRMAGCIDGGKCTELDELKRECNTEQGMGQVLATACQKTAAGDLKYISVDGYYCQGRCDAAHEKCELQEGECDPYDLSNYGCDRQTLNTCYLNSNLIGEKRSVFCDEKCVAVDGIAACGYACANENEITRKCINAGSMKGKDSGKFVCRKIDNGSLYSIWTGDYDSCAGIVCDTQTGLCVE